MVFNSLGYINSLIGRFNPLAATFALKTCLALVIGYGLAFLFNFSALSTTFTILYLNTRYLGSSVDKALLRITGTFAGAGIAIVLMAFIAQEKYMFLFTLAVINAFLFYKMQGSRYPYAWYICALTILIVGFGSVENPDNVFPAAVSRVSGVLLGIVTSLVVNGLLWPSKAGDDYEKQLRNILRQTCNLLNFKYSAYITEGKDANKIPELEKNIILSTPRLKTTLNAAARDTGRFSRFTGSYTVLTSQIEDLVNHIFDLGETLKNCTVYPDLILLIKNSETYTETLNLVEQHFRKLIADCDLPRDGSITDESDALFESELKKRMHSLIAGFKSKALKPEKELALSIMLKKLNEVALLIVKIRNTLLTVENPDKLEFFNATQPDIFETDKSFDIRGQRFIKAVTSSLIIVLVAILWITTDWPLGYSTLVISAWALTYVNIVSPFIPTRKLISGLMYAAGVGFVLYFMLMPRLDNFFELVPVLIFALFPFCYKMNDPNPLTATWGILGASLLLEFVNITEEQTYSFSIFTNSIIGGGGGLLLGILLLSIFSYRTPEREFKKQIVSFFDLCQRTIELMENHKPLTEKDSSIPLGTRRELIGKIKLIALWSIMLSYNRTDSYDRQKIGAVLSSVSNIIFRLDSLEHARQEYRDKSLTTLAGETEEEMCDALTNRFALLKDSVVNNEQVPAFTDVSGKVSELVTSLREDGKRGNIDQKLREDAIQILLINGFYQSLASSLEECRGNVNRLDWNVFDQAYF